MNILAVIPARSGSKSVPKKNIKLLNGKPLIYYTIKEAKKSKLITNLIVSSDSNQTLYISKKYKCDVLKRPTKISSDNTPMWPVALHAMKETESMYNKKYDYIMILQPTTPLRSCKDIDISIKKIIKEKSSSLISVVRVEDNHPARMYKTRKNRLISLNKKLSTYNRQNLPTIFHRNGAIYITKRSILKKNKFLGENLSYYEMAKEFSINIDDKFDWKLAELILKNENNKS